MNDKKDSKHAVKFKTMLSLSKYKTKKHIYIYKNLDLLASSHHHNL